jgi:hypothetical protein
VNLIPPYVIFAVIGIALLAGLAGAIALDRWIRRRLRVAAAIVKADVERQRSTFQTEMDRHGITDRGTVPADQVPGAAERAAWDDTQQLRPVVDHRPQHAAPDRDELVEQLHTYGWTRGELQANATGHRLPFPRYAEDPR